MSKESTDSFPVFVRLATIARTDAERIRAKWEAMSPEERLARQCREWEQAKLLGSGVPGRTLAEYRKAKGRH